MKRSFLATKPQHWKQYKNATGLKLRNYWRSQHPVSRYESISQVIQKWLMTLLTSIQDRKDRNAPTAISGRFGFLPNNEPVQKTTWQRWHHYLHIKFCRQDAFAPGYYRNVLRRRIKKQMQSLIIFRWLSLRWNTSERLTKNISQHTEHFNRFVAARHRRTHTHTKKKLENMTVEWWAHLLIHAYFALVFAIHFTSRFIRKCTYLHSENSSAKEHMRKSNIS